MINWQFYPKSTDTPDHLMKVVKAFETQADRIDSTNYKYSSNEVLKFLRTDLENINFKVEKSKKQKDKIQVPVLFGRNGSLEKYFDADAFNNDTRTVIEVEAGRGVTNYQFLKDLFQACILTNVKF